MRRAAALLAALAVAGCTVGPDYHRTDFPAPPFGTEPADTPSRTFAGEVDVRWWTAFGDGELSSLVDRLGRQNLDLAQAVERIQQARAERGLARSQGLPMIQQHDQYLRERESPNGTPSLVQPAPGAPLQFNYFHPQATASWEVDLFGRVRRLVEAADAQTAAAVEARHGVALSAIAELAGDYLQLRGLQAQQLLVEDDIRVADQRRVLVRNRFANGVATTLDVAQADAQALSVAQDLPTITTQEAQLINAIGTLLAEPPRALSGELRRPSPQPLVPPAVPVGLAADLARRRPDVRQAEAELHAATAQTGVAVASFYPDLRLDGSFGFESLHIGSLFDWASREFMVGPTLTVPVFQGGRLTSTLRLRESQQREAALRLRQTVLQAWTDVDNALTAYAQTQHRRADVFATGEANRRALAAAEQQYLHGETTMLDVITAQEAVFRSDSQLADAQAQLTQRLVDLYRALGGGWQAIPEPAPPAKADEIHPFAQVIRTPFARRAPRDGS